MNVPDIFYKYNVSRWTIIIEEIRGGKISIPSLSDDEIKIIAEKKPALLEELQTLFPAQKEKIEHFKKFFVYVS